MLFKPFQTTRTLVTAFIFFTLLSSSLNVFGSLNPSPQNENYILRFESPKEWQDYFYTLFPEQPPLGLFPTQEDIGKQNQIEIDLRALSNKGFRIRLGEHLYFDQGRVVFEQTMSNTQAEKVLGLPAGSLIQNANSSMDVDLTEVLPKTVLESAFTSFMRSNCMTTAIRASQNESIGSGPSLDTDNMYMVKIFDQMNEKYEFAADYVLAGGQIYRNNEGNLYQTYGYDLQFGDLVFFGPNFLGDFLKFHADYRDNSVTRNNVVQSWVFIERDSRVPQIVHGPTNLSIIKESLSHRNLMEHILSLNSSDIHPKYSSEVFTGKEGLLTQTQHVIYFLGLANDLVFQKAGWNDRLPFMIESRDSAFKPYVNGAKENVLVIKVYRKKK